jgi:hypothetical protein
MNDAIFRMYCEQKNLLKRAEKSEIKGVDDRELIRDWQQAIEILESSSPDYKYRYDQLIKNQESFTPEQINFICYQIGDWYIEWKDRIVVDLKEGTHRLGYAKEQLKSIICGE